MADMRAMFESKYVGVWDLKGEDRTVTIDRVEQGKVIGEGGKTDRAPLIYFRGKAKPLVGNKTALKVLADLFGSFDSEAMKGKQITLYPTTCKGARGGIVPCVRIRPEAPKQGTADAKSLDEPVDPVARAAQKAEADEGRQPGDD